MSDKGPIRTSDEWQRLKPKITIIDPDGWDRHNFDYSWNIECITEAEYDRRVMFSTISSIEVIIEIEDSSKDGLG